MRGFERFLEVFRDFERFSEVFRGFERFLKSCCPLNFLQVIGWHVCRTKFARKLGSHDSGSQKYPQYCWKKRRPQPYWGGENSGNALEASNALNYRFWGIPAVLSRGIPGNALRAFPGSFRNFSEFPLESPSRSGGMAQAEEPKPAPAQKLKKSKRSLQGSLRGSLRRSRRTLRVKIHQFFF